MIGTPLELIRLKLPSDCISPSLGSYIIRITYTTKFCILHINVFPVFYEFGLLLIIPMVKEDEFFRVKAQVFSKSKPGLTFESFVILLNKFALLKNDRGWLIYCFLICLLFAASVNKAKNCHLIDSHWCNFILITFTLFYTNEFRE